MATHMANEKDEGGLVIQVEPTKANCAGAAAAYLLRTIAARAGSYAPGIEEKMFDELERLSIDLADVQRWFATYNQQLSYLGYRFMARRVAFRTPGIVAWVKAGDGFRGALLPTNVRVMHPDEKAPADHAVGLIAGGDPQKRNGVVMVDPWPGAGTIEVPANLDDARRELRWSGLLFFWAGYS